MFSPPQRSPGSSVVNQNGGGDSTSAAATRNNNQSSDSLSFRADYYGGDFIEDGSFLVLSTDRLSTSPGSPPNGCCGEDIEVVNEVDEDGDETMEEVKPKTPNASLSKSQVLGEDVESSVEESNNQQNLAANSLQRLSSSQNHLDTTMTNASTASSSISTEANLAETGEEVSLLVIENKKLTELLADSNEKMKQCISTTERLKNDHEEYKKKHEASRDIISQLRQDNEMLRSQVSENSASSLGSNSNDLSRQQETLQQNDQQSLNYTISELNERLQTVLNVNGQLNDELATNKKENEDLRKGITSLQEKYEDEKMKVDVMKKEIDSGRQAIQKFKEHQDVAQAEVESARAVIQNLEAVVEEKTKLIDSLRRNMEDTVSSLERCKSKLNEKEKQVSLLTTKVAAINAETQVFERMQVLEMQCQSYKSDFEKVREEKAKLCAEKDALLIELNATNQQLRATSETLDNMRRQSGEQFESEFVSRNDNFATNSAAANEPLQSPLASLPTVAGHLVGFVRRELLGWEDQASAPVDGGRDASNNSGGPPSSEGAAAATAPTAAAPTAAAAAEAVVQQPKQEPIPPCPICRRTFPSLERLQTHASNCGIEVDENPHDPFVFP